MKNRAIVLVYTQENEQSYCIGQVAVDNNIIDSLQFHKLFCDLWAEWRNEVPCPDSDSDFIDWLVDNKEGYYKDESSVISVTV